MVSLHREFEALLPIGYTDENGKTHKQAVLRKMCGYDEELLYDQSLDSGHLVTELIKCCLIRLGDIENLSSEIISKLYTADRNYLLFELRRITFGHELYSSYMCPNCGSNVSVLENLEDVVINRLDDNETLRDIHVSLEDGYHDREGKTHTELTLTLPRGKDEEFVSPMLSRDPLSAQDALLLRCIKQFGELPKPSLDAYGVKILRDLTMGDRYKLQNALAEDLPGIDLRRLVHCGPCNNTFRGMMDVTNFFVPG